MAVWCERHIMAYDAFDVMKLVMWLKSVQEIGTKYKTAGTTHYQSSLFMSLEHHAWCSWICDALALVSAKLCWMWSMKWVTVTTRTKETQACCRVGIVGIHTKADNIAEIDVLVCSVREGGPTRL